MCREKGGLPHNFDLVIGPTADDDTMVCLNSYWRGLYGEVGSDEAKEKLLNSETYRILMESNFGLFLETDSYLNNSLDIEFEKDKEALY